eukprot:8590944-Alexandrium_andersonii.AAC.1
MHRRSRLDKHCASAQAGTVRSALSGFGGLHEARAARLANLAKEAECFTGPGKRVVKPISAVQPRP